MVVGGSNGPETDFSLHLELAESQIFHKQLSKFVASHTPFLLLASECSFLEAMAWSRGFFAWRVVYFLSSLAVLFTSFRRWTDDIVEILAVGIVSRKDATVNTKCEMKGLPSLSGLSSVAGGSEHGIVLRVCPFRSGETGGLGTLVMCCGPGSLVCHCLQK